MCSFDNDFSAFSLQGRYSLPCQWSMQYVTYCSGGHYWNHCTRSSPYPVKCTCEHQWCCLISLGIPIAKIRWANDHHIFMMDILILIKMVFILKWAIHVGGWNICTHTHTQRRGWYLAVVMWRIVLSPMADKTALSWLKISVTEIWASLQSVTCKNWLVMEDWQNFNCTDPKTKASIGTINSSNNSGGINLKCILEPLGWMQQVILNNHQFCLGRSCGHDIIPHLGAIIRVFGPWG